MTRKYLTLDDVLAEEMKNPEFKRKWDALEPEYNALLAKLQAAEGAENSARQRKTHSSPQLLRRVALSVAA